MPFEVVAIRAELLCCNTNPLGGGSRSMSLIAEALIITRRSQKIATYRPTLSEPLSQQDVRCLGVGGALGRSTNQSALRRAR